MSDFQMERVDITCPKCGRRDYMYRLSGKNVGKLNIKCTNCNSYYDLIADYSYLIGIRRKGEPMDDLISRQAAIDVLNELARDSFTIKDTFQIYLDALKDADLKIRQVPTAEKKGKWLPLGEGWACCSACEALERAAGLRWRYCPNCGARMET